jgi:hypothetical protein
MFSYFGLSSTIPRNSLSPRYINIATTRYNCKIPTGAKNTNKPKRKNKRKKKETNAQIDIREDGPQPMHPLENSTTLICDRIAPYQATSSRRNAMMTILLPGLVLGFLVVHAGEWGRGTHDALEEGRAAPASVAASVLANPTRISPDPQKSTAPHSS